jgi:IS605 OrfB family transposase
MKLTAKIKLQPTPDQAQTLLETIKQANAAADYISQVAWDSQTFTQYRLHHLVYYEVKERFGLTAQVVVRAISKVVDAYKLDKDTQRTFKPHGGIAYDDRILRYYPDQQEVSIWTIAGRMKIPFVAGPNQLELLKYRKGESDLVYIRGHWFLLATCEIETPDQISDIEGVLGIDLGIVQIATDSEGNQYSGSEVLSVRKRRRRQRKRLQKKGTKSAKRRLRKLSGKEARFSTHQNHVISKQIVKTAVDTNQAIALEDLKGIRLRARFRKPQRIDLHSWAFAQLGSFIVYKAALAGVPVVFVDPAYTSQTCSACGYIDKKNRTSQSNFSCRSCGHADHADRNAAMNISVRGWGVINHPHGSTPSA